MILRVTWPFLNPVILASRTTRFLQSGNGNIVIGDYAYAPWARELMTAAQSYFVHYLEVPEACGCVPNAELSELPVDGDPELALALLTWSVRGERFCPGAFAGSVKSGLVERRLKGMPRPL